VGGSCRDGRLAREVRRACGRDIGASVGDDPSTSIGVNTSTALGVNDSRRGTRGQLVGGTVEVQLAGNSEPLARG
jgi:hypothetical protein